MDPTDEMTVRTRFAPSPTGYLHIGGVRTALFNWLFARQHHGQFVLRIDDTDARRNVDEALAPILHGFRWLGIDWDEGPDVGGPFGPYYQSQRQAHYAAAVAKLLAAGAVYRDYATTAELQKERAAAEAAGQPFVYSRRWAAETAADQTRFEAEGRAGVVRLKMPRTGQLVVDDLVRGEVAFEWAQEQDHVIERADGSCLYHLATVVDDHLLQISHVIRAEEHLSNTPRQIFIAQQLGYPLPRYAHLPVVAEPGSRHKLSKRKLDKYLKNRDFAAIAKHGQQIADCLGLSTTAETFNPVLVDFYATVGYLPDAVINYLLLLGWSLDDKTEEFTRAEMIDRFSLDRVRRAPASFDPARLQAFQQRRMQRLPVADKLALVMPYLVRAGSIAALPPDETVKRVEAIVTAAGDRIAVAGDILDYNDFFVADDRLRYDEKAFEKRLRKPPEATRLLARFRIALAGVQPFEPGQIEAALRDFASAEEIKIGQIIHPLRVAVTGKSVGFGLFETLAILGPESSLARIDRALATVEPPAAAAPRPATSQGAAKSRVSGEEKKKAGKPAGAAAANAESEASEASTASAAPSLHFIQQIIAQDMVSSKFGGRVHTRFPPEPNGYLHIGHAKSICLNFGLAQQYQGLCNLRFDDTNPVKEEAEYIESILEDVRWLGFDWGDRLYYASDYFDQLYAWAEQLIRDGKAYVCDLIPAETRRLRGTLTEPGTDSPFRSRGVEENLALFRRMRAGELPDGSRTLRAKIDMASPNMNLRDPVMYRILHASHHRTGDKWCIYPMYDFTHGQSDSIEKITHSICTLEFENHRPLYDWYLDQLDIDHPQQIEFARLNLTYTMMSKRRLLELVNERLVTGWDDPRMPTLSGLRRRGYTPRSIRTFCDRIGVAKFNSVIDVRVLENSLREDLNQHAPRVMAVLRPLKVVIDNYPEDQSEQLEAINNPEDPAAGTRRVPFSRVLYIERDDFQEDPPKKFFRLAPGREVRLRYGYYITCVDLVKDDTTGEVVELHCTYDPATHGGSSPDGRKVKATLHWVSAAHAVAAEVRLYDHLFRTEDPDDAAAGEDWRSNLNPDSLERLTECYVEPSLAAATPGARFQFERLGYFCIDPDSSTDRLVFNRTVSLRDTWAKIQKGQKTQKGQKQGRGGAKK